MPKHGDGWVGCRQCHKWVAMTTAAAISAAFLGALAFTCFAIASRYRENADSEHRSYEQADRRADNCEVDKKVAEGKLQKVDEMLGVARARRMMH